MAEKPSYLGLLNAISCAETHAHEYLTEWIGVTRDPEVRKVLTIVATREGEHGMAFAKRIHELGFEVREKEDPKQEERMAIVRSDRSDLDKLEAIGVLDIVVADGEPDIFDGFFRDHSIDIETGGLLGRYIAEERDTLRLLTGCKAELEAKAVPTFRDDGRLDALEEKVDSVLRVVEEVRGVVSQLWEFGRQFFPFGRSTTNGGTADRERTETP